MTDRITNATATGAGGARHYTPHSEVAEFLADARRLWWRSLLAGIIAVAMISCGAAFIIAASAAIVSCS